MIASPTASTRQRQLIWLRQAPLGDPRAELRSSTVPRSRPSHEPCPRAARRAQPFLSAQCATSCIICVTSQSAPTHPKVPPPGCPASASPRMCMSLRVTMCVNRPPSRLVAGRRHARLVTTATKGPCKPEPFDGQAASLLSRSATAIRDCMIRWPLLCQWRSWRGSRRRRWRRSQPRCWWCIATTALQHVGHHPCRQGQACQQQGW